MDVTLKKLCEIACAREFYKNPTLRPLVPKVWDSNATVRLPHFSIQAVPSGEEWQWRTGIYGVEVTAMVEGKPRKHDVDFYLSQADKTFGQWSILDKPGFESLFMQYGIYVHGVIPRQAPATMEGSSRIENSVVTLVARIL